MKQQQKLRHIQIIKKKSESSPPSSRSNCLFTDFARISYKLYKTYLFKSSSCKVSKTAD